MGAARETFALWRNWRGVWRKLRRGHMDWRLLFDDNVMPAVCKVVGHDAYDTGTIYDPPEMACRRCHRFLPHLNATVQKVVLLSPWRQAELKNAKVPPRHQGLGGNR